MKTFIIWSLLFLSLISTIIFLLSKQSDINFPFRADKPVDIATTTAPLTFDQAIVYTCAGGSVVAAAFKTGDTSIIELSLPDNGPMILNSMETASGAKYISETGVVFWEKAGTALVEKDGTVIYADCKIGQPEPQVPTASSTKSELEGTKWTWVETSFASGSSTTPNKPEDFVLTFSENGRFSSNTDCNNVGGSYVGGVDGAISFTEMVSTLMACSGDVKEGEYIGQLGKVVSYKVNQDELVLSLKSDEENGEMKFTKE